MWQALRTLEATATDILPTAIESRMASTRASPEPTQWNQQGTDLHRPPFTSHTDSLVGIGIGTDVSTAQGTDNVIPNPDAGLGDRINDVARGNAGAGAIADAILSISDPASVIGLGQGDDPLTWALMGGFANTHRNGYDSMGMGALAEGGSETVEPLDRPVGNNNVALDPAISNLLWTMAGDINSMAGMGPLDLSWPLNSY